MKIEATLGNPVEPGIYAARQWYGWRILEWHSGQWWYPGKVAQWPHKAEIEAHIGPLPVIAQDFSVPEKFTGGLDFAENTLYEYDPAREAQREADRELYQSVAPMGQEYDL